MFNSFHTAGVTAFNENNYGGARELFIQAIKLNPETSESFLYLGKCCFLIDAKKQQAIIFLKKFVELEQNNPDNVDNVSYAFDLLGQCYEAENKDKKALKCYETATKIYPSCASAWHNMGLLYIKSAQHYLEKDPSISIKFFNGAQFFIQKALKICSDNPIFLNSVASWYEKYIGVLQKTLKDRDAVQKNITNTFSHAIKYYRNALALCKEKDFTLKNIILSNLTECLAQYGHHLYQNSNYKEAQEIYLEAIHLDSEHLIAINQLGMSLFKQDRFHEARSYFASILKKTEKKKKVADAWLNIACTYRLEKEWDKAEEALNEAKKFAPGNSSIDNEEMKLTNSKLATILISTPQTLFGNSTPAQDIRNSVNKESSFYFN